MHQTITAKLAVLLVCASASSAVIAEPWWQPYSQRPGFIEALAQFGLTPDDLDNPARQDRERAENFNDPLYWLKRTVQMYGQADAGEYQVPVTDSSYRSEKARLGTFGSHDAYLFTYTFVQPGDQVSITAGHYDSAALDCGASTATALEAQAHQYDYLGIKPGQTVQYQAQRPGTLTLYCSDKSDQFAHAGTMVPFKLGAGGTPYRFFTFGLDTTQDWAQTMHLQANGLNQTILSNGKTYFYLPVSRAQKPAGDSIMRSMREHLELTTEYDKLAGLTGSGGTLELPAYGFYIADFANCCSADAAHGQLNIGFGSGNIGTTGWGEWHEYAHEYEASWKWGAMLEVINNIGSITACRHFKGEVPMSQCHLDDQVSNSHESVGLFLRDGQARVFDNENAFGRLEMLTQLLFTYDDLFPSLNKAFRQLWQAGKYSTELGSDQQKIDWFVVQASTSAGRDLRAFFDKWGLSYSDKARQAVAGLSLPSPVIPSAVRSTTLSSQGEPVRRAIYVPSPEGHEGLIGFEAYNPQTGPTSLVYQGSDPTRLTASLLDDQGRRFNVVLRGERGSGIADDPDLATDDEYGLYSASWGWPLNSFIASWDAAGAYAAVSYDPADNPDLPAGHYHGNLHLAAREKLPGTAWWGPDAGAEDPTWGEELNFALEITKH